MPSVVTVYFGQTRFLSISQHRPEVPVEVQYSLKLDCSKVAQDLAEGSKNFSELLYDKALWWRQ